VEKQKEEITERKRIRAEAKKAMLEQIVEEEAEKARMEQIREAADQKVDSLLAGGLAAELRKKGKSTSEEVEDFVGTYVLHHSRAGWWSGGSGRGRRARQSRPKRRRLQFQITGRTRRGPSRFVGIPGRDKRNRPTQPRCKEHEKMSSQPKRGSKILL
jgi:hypothetical protein